MLFEIAWKNVWRNKTRSLIILTAIALGLMGGLLSSAVSFGMGEQMMQSAILTRLSHIQIHHPEFAKDRDIDFTIPDAGMLSERIEKLPNVSAVSPRVVVTAMAASAVTASGVQLLGVLPSREASVSIIDKSISQGSFFDSDIRNPVVIGDELARTLDVNQGSKVVFTFQNDSGEITGGAFRVAGIFSTVSSEFDKGTVFVKAGDLIRLLETDTVFQEVAVLLVNGVRIDSTIKDIRELAPQMQIDTWRTLAPELDYLSETLAASLYIFMVVILLALAFGIINTMLMVVLERRRELGMLLAVGMSRKLVFAMIVLETVMLSLTGAFAGMVLTVAAMALLSRTGINLSYFAQGLEEFGIGEILYPQLPLSMYAILTVMVVFVAVFAAAYPARRALKLNPSDALRM